MTVRLTLVEWRSEPLAPVMVNVYVFTWVRDVVETVNVEVPGGVSELGLNVQVARDGQPLRLSETGELKPFSTPSVTV